MTLYAAFMFVAACLILIGATLVGVFDLKGEAG